MTTHSSILAWEIPWTEELVGMESQQVVYDWEHTHRHLQPDLCVFTPFNPQTPPWIVMMSVSVLQMGSKVTQPFVLSYPKSHSDQVAGRQLGDNEIRSGGVS